MNRTELIRQKEELRAEIAVLRRKLAALDSQESKQAAREAEALEARLAALQAEETRLRLLIDRSH